MPTRTVLIASLLFASQLFAADVPPLPHIRLIPFATHLQDPVDLADDESGRIFIVEKPGRIRLMDGGQLLQQPYLDISDHVYSGFSECGLLGVAFHPGFAKNGRLFVMYSTKSSGHLESVVSEFKTAPDAKTVDATSERVLLRYDKPYLNHNGGQIKFGPDGMLYFGAGDGGSGGDPEGHGQSLNTFLGKIMRIDVDHKEPYAIPDDNPFVKQQGAFPEIWAFGLRNPWRFSFDRETHQLYCGDVGQNLWEEVDIIEKGKNYGWSAKEGFHDFIPKRAVGQLTDPIKEYGHYQGDNCIIGGYLYRGKQVPALKGIYIYGDNGSGRIWGLKWDGKALTFDAELLHPNMHMSSFGEDKDGELYVLDLAGTVYRITE